VLRKPLQRQATVNSRRLVAGIMASAVVVGVAVGFINNDRGADAVALHEVNSVRPQAHWSIIRRSFEPWASVVSRGSYRMTGGSGPAWVLELSAPGDSKFNNYSAVVVVSAISGSMWHESATPGSRDPDRSWQTSVYPTQLRTQ
jgi:hypothetical protein